jgi:ribosomal protein S12 methylthiotransferase accessory factor
LLLTGTAAAPAGTAAGAVALAPEAEFWLLPGAGLIGRFADDMRGFAGTIAEHAALALGSGALPAADLFARLCTQIAPDQAYRGLDRLRAGGLLVPCDGRARVPAAAADLLAAAGLRLWPDRPQRGGGGGPWIVPGPLADLDRRPLPDGDWLPVEVTAARITVGPLFPASGPRPCLACLAERARAHDDLGRLLAAHRGARALGPRRLEPEARQAEIGFLRAATAALGRHTPGAILWRAAGGAATGTARATGRGGCPSCGLAPARLDLPAGRTARLRAGGYRPLGAAAILRQIKGVVDPVSGIVRDLLPRPAAAPVRPMSQVFVARHAFPLARPDLRSTLRNLQGRSAGKGRREAEGRLGAIAEALERYAGLARPGDVQRMARARDLGAEVIAPNDWMLYSPAQLSEAADWRALDDPAAFVPDPVDPDRPLEWTRVTDLISGAAAWAPAALCWHQFRPALPGPLPGIACSNGCAAGQTRIDALVQGLLELIERDAVGIWWQARARRPEIALHGRGDRWLDRVCEALAALGYDLVAQDLTHDLGVCVVAAIAWPGRGAGPVLFGFGAHLSPATALSRAVTEVLQVLPNRPAGDLGGLPWAGLGRVPGSIPPGLADFDFLRPRGEGGIAEPGQELPPAPATADAALAQLLRTLDAAGMRVYALDQGRPDVPLAVQRVIVPGLRHFRPRLAPGRLDSVPARLGWARDPRGPNPCFIRQ